MLEKQIANEIFVTIIGSSHHNTLGLLRSIGEAGIKNIQLILVGIGPNEHSFVAKSKYIKRRDTIFLKNKCQIVECLLQYADVKKKRVCICCSDDSSEEVISHRLELEPFYFIPSVSIDIHDLMVKSNQTRIAKECGFCVPLSKSVDKKDYQSWDSFPCIIKPSKSTLGAGKKDIKVCLNESAYQKAIQEISSDTIQVQSFIDKTLEYQLIGCSLDGGKEIIIPGFTTLIRQPNNTNTGYLKLRPIGELNYNYDAIKCFLETIGYSGLFSLEFIRDKNGVDYFLEINMRNDGNAYCVQTAGVNLPLIWTLYGSGKDYSTAKKEFDKSVYFMPEFSDFRMGLKAVGFFKWLYQFFKAKSHAVYNVRDIKPFLFFLFHRKKH